MKKISLVLSFILAPVWGSSTALAQPEIVELCGLPDNAESLEQVYTNILGTWQIQHLSGYTNAGGMIIPFGANPDGPETITLVREGNKMFMTHSMAQEPMELRRPSREEWIFLADDTSSGMPRPKVGSEDMADLTDCNNSDLPRLIGRGTIIMDGLTMNFTYRLILTTLVDLRNTGSYSGNLYGVMHFNTVARGIPMNMRRTVLLTR